ncbi:hypothetical protein [uncultured Maribacter sp.]|uniref:hypothetical protein n=1 Tax=uncultured Maribacter sp. TaxID=431308 RepID=UPI0026136B3A|nr:hypothetical protein [uncultured Maribacter sp.]
MGSLILNFVMSQLFNFNLEINEKLDGREGVDFLIGDNELYLQSIDLDTVQRSIKIAKQDLLGLKDNLFIALIVVLDKEPRVIYLIPSKDLLQSDSNIFTDNEISLMPSLSNWEIKVSTYVIPELAEYSLEKMIHKLKV